MEVLTASGKQFKCHSPSGEYKLEYKNLFSKLGDKKKELFKKNGYLVIKNILSKKDIANARNTYFSLFQKGEYEKKYGDWIHIKNHEDSPGCNNHPSRDFLQNQHFFNIIENQNLKKATCWILNSETSIMSPRIIVRSFSKLSERCTFAHRDKEYFKSANSKNVFTCWIPLGPIGSEFGQLIYLENSHTEEKRIDKLVNSQKIISKDLNKLANDLNLNWIRPILEEGDILLHSLDIVHASFDSFSNVPRLSLDLRYALSLEDTDQRWSQSWRGDDGL